MTDAVDVLDGVSPVDIHNENGQSRIVLVCEHASNHLPPSLENLGLSEAKLKEHIAWDPGALGVARQLSHLMDAPLVYANVSRLMLDINRGPGHAGSIVKVSELTLIPGNANLTAADIAGRVEAIYDPFHAALASIVGRRRNTPPWVVSIHSFTPIYKGIPRPWDIGVLHNEDERLATPLLAALNKDPELVVGDNEPYAPTDGVYHTIERHTAPNGYAGAMIEIRNDLIKDSAGEHIWATRLSEIFRDMLATDPS
jgi:predicted N-formylglutamate amidohydrolase